MEISTAADPRTFSMKLKTKILIVEDGAEMSNLLITALDDSGYQTIHAAEGKSAVKIAIKEQPNLILLDIMPRDRAGLKVCRPLQPHPKKSHIKVIMVSALS